MVDAPAGGTGNARLEGREDRRRGGWDRAVRIPPVRTQSWGRSLQARGLERAGSEVLAPRVAQSWFRRLRVRLRRLRDDGPRSVGARRGSTRRLDGKLSISEPEGELVVQPALDDQLGAGAQVPGFPLRELFQREAVKSRHYILKSLPSPEASGHHRPPARSDHRAGARSSPPSIS